MKTLAVIAALVLLVLLAILLARTFGMGVAWWQARRVKRAPWKLEQEPDDDGEQMCVYAVRLGGEKLLVGKAPFGAEDFDSQLYTLRSVGKVRVHALNDQDDDLDF